MSLLLFDTYDHYATADLTTKWSAAYQASIVTGGAHGNGAFTHEFSLLQTSLPASGDMFIMGTNVKPNVLGGLEGYGYAFVLAMAGGSTQCYLNWDTAGYIRALRGDNTLLGVSSMPLVAGLQQFVEVKFKISNTVGTVEVRFNGATVLSLTNQDTQTTATSTWNTIRMSCGASGGGRSCIFDDTYVCDGVAGPVGGPTVNDFLGPVRAVGLFPTGAGASTDLTPSTGANWQNVDDASQDGDTTYNTAVTPGDHDTYTMGNLGITGNVIAVQTNLMVRSAGAGAETVAPMLRVNSIDYPGTAVGISTSYVDKREIFVVSPDTAVAWTVSEIDGTEFGPKLVT